MLPKFANNLFGRTTNTFRQGFFNTSQGNSAGGAKYNAGSRFYNYSGYTGPGRAFSQANTVTANDDERQPRLHRLTLTPRPSPLHIPNGVPPHPHFACVRRNSTSTSTAAESEKTFPLPLFSNPPKISIPPNTDPAAPQSVEEPAFSSRQVSALEQESENDTEVPGYKVLELAANRGNHSYAVKVAIDYRRRCPRHTTAGFNMALTALERTRPASDPVNVVLETYNDMIEKGLMPNLGTYRILLQALCSRDHEVSNMISVIESRLRRRSWAGLVVPTRAQDFDHRRIDALKSENNFASALVIFQAAAGLTTSQPLNANLSPPIALRQTNALDIGTYSLLLRSCANHAAVDAAIRIFAHLERYALKSLPTGCVPARIYSNLISVYTSASDVRGAKEVFDEFRKLSADNKIYWAEAENSGELDEFEAFTVGKRSGRARVTQSLIWTEMIKAHLAVGDGPAGLSLLEEMLDTPRGVEFGPADAPLPSAATYASIIAGFCRNGDVDTASAWFEKLLNQTYSPANDFEPVATPPRPTMAAWVTIFDNLALAAIQSSENNSKEVRTNESKLDTLNRIWNAAIECFDNDSSLRFLDRFTIARSNFKYLMLLEEEGKLSASRRKEVVDFLREKVIRFTVDPSTDGIPLLTASASETIQSMMTLCLKIAEEAGPNTEASSFYSQEPVRMLVDFVDASRQALLSGNINNLGWGWGDARRYLHSTLTNCVALVLGGRTPNPAGGPWIPPTQLLDPTSKLDFIRALDICGVILEYSSLSNSSLAACFSRLYVSSRRSGVPDLTIRQWSTLGHFIGITSISPLEKTFKYIPLDQYPDHPDDLAVLDIRDLLRDMATAKINPDELVVSAKRKITKTLYSMLGVTDGIKFLRTLGPQFDGLRESNISGHPSSFAPAVLPPTDISELNLDLNTAKPAPVKSEFIDAPEQHDIVIDDILSRSIDEYFPLHRFLTPIDGYKRFLAGRARGLWPRPEVIGRLINAMGRLNEREAVKTLYEAAQVVLASMEKNKEQQSLAWFQVEDQMVIAWAHAGDTEAAHIHRDRIVKQGGTPSADAYGALISSIKDTTDDVSSALYLWGEARGRGVRPNLFLYNTVISRLARARKAEHALELFQEMTAAGIYPSTVTYGAIITACCRVGDANSAEKLFKQMQAARKYFPRVPPFNTIIQLFTNTKPNREKVEYYFGLMKGQGVQPSDHTYRLLLDAYGTIQPIDIPATERTFQALLEDRKVKVNGTHWASLINAYGCGQRDLTKAQQVFNKMLRHPANQFLTSNLPDAIVFEAMFNVLVTHHRADLFSMYLDLMQKKNVHMTAYVANLLIKGYTTTGSIDQARELFESLVDPPVGVAAPDNHQSHDQSPTSLISPNAPVYREPSTWEAMVRAELSANNRDLALNLIARMENRGYPIAVVQRIKSILHDDSPSTYSPPMSTATPISEQSTLGSSTPPSSIF